MKYTNHYILLAVFLLFGFLLTPLGNYKQPGQMHSGYYNVQNIDQGDDTGYYAYLRSGLIDGDFDFLNEKGFWHFNFITATGYTANFWYIGQALLWFPFFLIGHGVAWLYGALGYPVAMDGYSFPYHASTFLASACEVFIALILCHKILKRFYSQSASLAATLLIFTATCLPYFTFIRSRMSHSGDILAAFVFFLFFLDFRDRRERPPLFFVWWGIWAGILFDLRYSNLVYLILPCGLLLKTWLADKEFFNREKKNLQGILLGGLAFLVTTLPQWVTWLKLNGAMKPETSGMAIALRPGLIGLLSAFRDLFFSRAWGITFAEPIWLLGLAGLAVVVKKDRWLGSLCGLTFLGCAVVPIALGNGASFGQRYLIPAFPVLAMGLGQLIDLPRINRSLVIIIASIMSLWIYVLLLNYSYLIHYDNPDFALQALRNIPALISGKSLLPPTSYLDHYLNNRLELADFFDYFFLIIFPILFAGTPFLFLVCMRRIVSAGFQSSIIKGFPTLFLAGMLCLTLFILIRHPELSPKTKKERLQTAATTELIKDSSNLSGMNKLLLRGEDLTPPNERDYLIRADAELLRGNLKQAQEFYLQAISLNDQSTAILQLERMDLIAKKEVPADTLTRLQELSRRGDPTGEITRLIGIYYLDLLAEPEKAIAYFNASLQINPTQKQAAGIKRLIAQYTMQMEQIRRKQHMGRLPVDLNLMLNTDFNEVLLNDFMLPYSF